MREKVTFHTSAISLFLATLGTSTLGKIEKKLEEIVKEMRCGRREPTVLTAVSDENEEVESAWNTLRAELVDDGFTKQDLEAHKRWIKAHLHELKAQGLLQEAAESDVKSRHSSLPQLGEKPPISGSDEPM